MDLCKATLSIYDKTGVERVVEVYLERTNNLDIVVQEAAAFCDIDAITAQGAGSRKTAKKATDSIRQDSSIISIIDFNRLPKMTPSEVDKLAILYIDTKNEFSSVYNMRPYMSTDGIDRAVYHYLDKTGDYGLIGAMLQSMSREAAKNVALRYFQSNASGEYDWIFENYR